MPKVVPRDVCVYKPEVAGRYARQVRRAAGCRSVRKIEIAGVAVNADVCADDRLAAARVSARMLHREGGVLFGPIGLER